MTQLVRINRDTGDAGELLEKMEHLGVDPCGFAVTVGVKGVEPDFHPLGQRDTLDIVDGHPVLEGKSCVIGAQGQAAFWRQTPEKNLYATPRLGFVDMVWVTASGAVEFAIANGDRLATHVQNLLALLQVELPDRKLRRLELFCQRYLVATDQRHCVAEQLLHVAPRLRSAGRTVLELPVELDAQGIVQLRLLRHGDGELFNPF